MAWYRAGTVSVTNGSASVTGSGTAFVANVSIGEGIVLPDGRIYEITNVSSDTSLTLATNYLGSTASGQPYAIAPLRGRIAQLLSETSSLIASFAGVRDGIGAGLFPDGTVTAPSFRFSSSQTTGIFRPGANRLAVSTNGVQRFEVDASGNALFTQTLQTPLGAVGTPSYTFTGDLNTGMWSPSADAIAFSTAGSERVRIDSSGRVGVGTTSPSEKLAVSGGDILLSNAFSLKGRNAANTLSISMIRRNASDQVAIDEDGYGTVIGFGGTLGVYGSGNVGIGTTSPGARLDASRGHTTNGLAGVVAFPQFAVTNPANWGYPAGMLFRAPLTDGGAVANNAAIWSQWESDNNSHVALATTGSGTLAERMRIDGSGNVGIGTSSPGAKFEVSVNGTTSAFFRLTDTQAGGRVWSINNGFPAVGTLSFYDNTAAATRMVLDSSGNVGIGTSSPGARIAVAAASPAVGSRGTAYLFSTNAMGANLGGQLSFGGSFTGTSETVFGSIAGRKETGNDNDISGYLQFSTTNASLGNVERMRIDSSGNVGIGTSSPNERLVVAGSQINNVADAAYGIALNATTGNLRIVPYSTTYSSTAITAFSAGYAGLGPLTIEAADQRFRTGASERMRIDASGNLLVGTTSTSTTSASGVKVLPAANGANGPQVAVVTSASGSSTSSLSIYSTGASAFRFYVDDAGTIFATNTSISAISDIRLKENVRDLDAGLDTILALKPRRFDWKEGKGKDIRDDMGFIAQEVEDVLPALIGGWKAGEGEPDDLKSVKAGDLIPVLVKAIQELTARVAQLEGN
jgi:hypothetical protein